MELKLLPSQNNGYKIRGIHIEGSSLKGWLDEIERMNFTLDEVKSYPLPGKTANSVSGCLIIFEQEIKIKDISKNRYCQQVGRNLFIPQYSELYPQVSEQELTDILSPNYHFLHPLIGLCELEECIDWSSLFSIPNQRQTESTKPAPTPFIPQRITSFRIEATHNVGLQEALEQIGEKKDLNAVNEKPLSLADKLRYRIYKTFIPDDESETVYDTDNSFILRSIDTVQKTGKIRKDGDEMWSERLLDDYKNLKNRSEDELNRLIRMLKENPEDALGYAVPIDEQGTSRGGELGSFQMNRNKNNISSLDKLFSGTRTSGAGSYTMEDESYKKLIEQYRESAKTLIKQEKFMQAAYVYITLLKDNYAAANLFQEKKMYHEAAEVYQKLIKSPLKAAECYEKGRMYMEAIDIYIKEELYEKVGDMYVLMNKRTKANQYYQKVVDKLTSESNYLKASEICISKMEEFDAGQHLLLEGWKSQARNYECLCKYLSNIKNEKSKGKEIRRIYAEDITENNKVIFLKVLKAEYVEGEELSVMIKDLAYEIVAQVVPHDKQIVSELLHFNKSNKQLIKDTIRYKLSNK